MKGFITFIREQGIVGLATGFILGGAVSKVVTSLVNDIVNPILGIVLGVVGDLSDATIKIGESTIMWGHFVNALIDFLVIAGIVYAAVKLLRVDRVDAKKG